MTRHLRIAPWILVAAAACKATPADRVPAAELAHDDARLAEVAVSARPTEIDCVTAIAALKGIELAGVASQFGELRPLASALNKITDVNGSAPPLDDAMADIKRRAIASLEQAWPAQAAAMAAECNASAWPAGARACYAQVRTDADVGACEAGLKGWQRRRLKAAVTRVVEPNAPRLALRVQSILRPVECSTYLLVGKVAQKCVRLPKAERDTIAATVDRDSAGWDLEGDTDGLAAPCEAAADRIVARFDAVGCKLDDLIGL